MRPRLSPVALGVVAAATIASPTPASAQCGLSELWGNDQIVTQVESDTPIGLGLSFFAHGPVLYALWNESGSLPVPHAAGVEKWISVVAGTLLHELGHDLKLRHGGPNTASNGQEVLFVTSDNGHLYKLDAQTGATLASADARRPACQEDKILATPAVQLYSYSNSAFQNAMMMARGMPDDLIFVVTHHGCGTTPETR